MSMTWAPFLVGVLVGIGLAILAGFLRHRHPPAPPPPPDDGITLEFILGEPREQPTPTQEPRR